MWSVVEFILLTCSARWCVYVEICHCNFYISQTLCVCLFSFPFSCFFHSPPTFLWTQSFTLVRQALYHLDHVSSPVFSFFSPTTLDIFIFCHFSDFLYILVFIVNISWRLNLIIMCSLPLNCKRILAISLWLFPILLTICSLVSLISQGYLVIITFIYKSISSYIFSVIFHAVYLTIPF
jgi:hypothetical protein